MSQFCILSHWANSVFRWNSRKFWSSQLAGIKMKKEEAFPFHHHPSIGLLQHTVPSGHTWGPLWTWRRGWAVLAKERRTIAPEEQRTVLHAYSCENATSECHVFSSSSSHWQQKCKCICSVWMYRIAAVYYYAVIKWNGPAGRKRGEAVTKKTKVTIFSAAGESLFPRNKHSQTTMCGLSI